MLRFYWTLGKDISFHKRESKQGNDFYATVSSDLKKELPDVKSFSATNIKYMQYFYELYSSPQVVDSADEKCSPQLVDSIEEIFKIPWGHHRYIIDKCKENREKALFFVRESLKNCWSRSVLLNFLDTNLYERKGKAITNFDKVLPDVQTDLAKEMTKDPYNFDFLTLRENFDEKELKDAIEKELGFALDWQRMDGKSASRIMYRLNGLNFDDHSNYDQLINEMIDTALLFTKVFKNRVK